MGNPFLKRFREFILAPSHSRTISAVVILIIAAAIPLTVLVAQQQQETRQFAATCTTNQDCPFGGTKAVCQTGSCMERRDACQGGVCINISAYSSRCSSTGCAGKTVCSNGQLCSNLTCSGTGSCYAATGASCVPSSSCGTTTTKYACINNACAVSSTGTFTESTCGGTCTTAPPTCVEGTRLCTPLGSTSYQECVGGVMVNKTCPTAGTVCLIGSAGTPSCGFLGGTDTCTTQGTGFACTTASICPTNFTQVTTSTCSNAATSTGVKPQICCKAVSTGALPPPAPAPANSFTQLLGPASQCVVFTTFSWTPPTGTVPTKYAIRYNLSGSSTTFGPYTTGTAGTTSTSITTPFAAGVTNGSGHSQCSIATQNQTGYSCGFVENTNVTWYAASLDATGVAGAWSAPQTYTTASCVTPAPVCTGGLTANPNSLFVGDTSNLSLTGCTGATTYKWASTCGTPASPTTSTPTTTWTAPANGPTVCTVTGSACNASGVCSTPYPAPITVNIHDCNTNPQLSACVATTSDTCSANNGTQTASYSPANGGTYNGNPVCNPVNITQPCTIPSCNVGNVCTNGTCTPSCTAPNTNCNGTCVNTQTSNSNCGTCGNACGSGKTCLGGVCGCTAPNNAFCNGACVNTQTSNSNCGTCGNACSSGQVCSNGTCTTSCTAPNTNCNGTCVNTQTSNSNCGACGNACTSGQTCTNGTCSLSPGNTYIAFTIGMDAIGSAGDNVNPNPSSSNQNPAHPTRNLAVQIFNSNNNQVFAQIGSISYNSGPGVFKGTVDLGANFASGNYLVLVKSDGHLRRRIPGIQNLTSALPQPIQLQRVNLVTGDVDNNNVLNINDYNILLSCVTDPDVANIDNHALCNSNANYVKLSDLEDNNVVNKFDYNLFLREYAVQSGD